MDVSFALPSFSYNTTIQRTKLLFFFHLCKNFAQILLKIFIFSRFHGIAGVFLLFFHANQRQTNATTNANSTLFALALSPNADFWAFTCGADTIFAISDIRKRRGDFSMKNVRIQFGRNRRNEGSPRKRRGVNSRMKTT